MVGAPAETADGPVESVAGVRWAPIAPLLVGTFVGTFNNSVVNVPLHGILRNLHVQLRQGVFVVVAFSLTLAVLLPIAGWTGDRVGRRRLFSIALIAVAVGSLGASLAPDLVLMVLFRGVQGAGSAAILPCVMGLITEIYGDRHRSRALGLWAAANGLGQAVGPAVGGVLAAWFSWRWIFLPVVPLAFTGVVGARLLVPDDAPRLAHLDWTGVVALTAGAGLLISGVTAVPLLGIASGPVLGLTLGGALAIVVFIWHVRRVVQPFIPPELIREASYLRSCVAVLAQMFCLGATLLAVPLYLTRDRGVSTSLAGVLVFALPAVMTLLAPGVGYLADRVGPRLVLRLGAGVLAASELLLALDLRSGGWGYGSLVMLLVGVGAGVALVQTPAATGATRSPAGRLGAGLGLFNLIRFTGFALGAAWVAIALSSGSHYGLVFAVCALCALAGLGGTWFGTVVVQRAAQ